MRTFDPYNIYKIVVLKIAYLHDTPVSPKVLLVQFSKKRNRGLHFGPPVLHKSGCSWNFKYFHASLITLYENKMKVGKIKCLKK